MCFRLRRRCSEIYRTTRHHQETASCITCGHVLCFTFLENALFRPARFTARWCGPSVMRGRYGGNYVSQRSGIPSNFESQISYPPTRRGTARIKLFCATAATILLVQRRTVKRENTPVSLDGSYTTYGVKYRREF